MTPEQRIDAALDSVLKASGSALRHYTMPKTLADMREAMRKAMFDEYIRKQCRDCGQFLPRDRWVRTDDPYKAHGLCRDCGGMYDDPAFM